MVFKSMLFSLILIVVITVPVYTQEDFAFNINSGYLGVGRVFPDSGNNDMGIVLTLVNIGIEHRPTNIGLEFTPYKNYSWINSGEDNKYNSSYFSFLNLKLYWNIITVLDNLIYFGAFTSADYLFAGESIYWDRYVFSAGGHIGFRLSYGRLNYDLFSTEIGYRNINGASKYFVEVKVDMLAFILSILYIGAGGSDD